jgi:hypothetical protein
MKGVMCVNDGSGKIKKNVLERDNWICQECGISQEQSIIIFGRKLDIHHFDRNNNNNKEENMITLCCKCHGNISGKDTKFHQGAKGKHWNMSKEDRENRSRLAKIYGFKKGHKNSERQKKLASKRFKGKTYEEIYGIEKAKELKKRRGHEVREGIAKKRRME